MSGGSASLGAGSVKGAPSRRDLPLRWAILRGQALGATVRDPRRAIRSALRPFTACLLATSASGCMIVEKGALDSGAPPASVVLPEDSAQPTPDTAATEEPAPTAPRLELRWTDERLEIASTPPSPGLLVGLAETRGPCLAVGACWTGEDCAEGFTDATGHLWGPICRPLDAAGALVLQGGAAISAVDADHTALRPETAGNITWSLWTERGGSPTTPCWAGGADPASLPDCVEAAAP